MKQNNTSNISSLRALARFLLIVLASLAPLLASAGTHTWTGAGITGNWSLPANWQGSTPPAAGEAAPVVLVFPLGAARPHNTNNIAGLTIHGMTVSGAGYAIEGVGAGTNVTFSTAGLTFYVFGAANFTLGTSLNITLVGTPTFSVTGGASFAGRLVGSSGFVKAGGGELALTGALENQFNGTVTVTGGNLSLNKGTPFFGGWLPAVAVPGPLIVGGTNLAVAGSVLLIHGDQIADAAPVTIQPSGTLYMGGNNETFGALTMVGGLLYGDSLETTNVGTLSLTADVSVPYTPISPSATITANLVLGSGVNRAFDVQLGHFNVYGIISDGGNAAGFTKNGPGQMFVANAANTYRGVTTINAGSIYIMGNGALGSTNNGTVINAGAQLAVQGANVAEALTINGGGANASIHCTANATLSGPVRLNGSVDVDVDFGVTLTMSGVISGSGGVNKVGEGTLAYTGFDANTYTGTTAVKGWLTLGKTTGLFSVQGIPGPLVIGEPGASSFVHTVRLLAANQIADSVPVTIFDGGNLDLNNHSDTCGPVTFDGGIAQSGTGTLTLGDDVTTTARGGIIYGKLSLGGVARQFNGPGNLAINAQVSDGAASAGVTKNDSGTLQLMNSNTFTGPVLINAGYVTASSAGALGVGPALVTVTSGSQLQLFSFDPTSGGGPAGFTIATRTLSLAGNGPNNDGALRNFGTNDWSGPIVLPVAGVFVGVEQTSPFAKLTLSGPITGGGSLWCNGLGIFRISGANDNTFTGKLSVTGTNTMVLSKSGGAIAVPGPLIIGDDYGTNVVKVTRVLLGAPNQIDNAASVTFYSSGVLDTSSYNETVGPIIFSGQGDFWSGGGNIVGSGTLTITDDITNNGDWANIFCPLSLGGQTRSFHCDGLGISVYGSISDGGGSAGIIQDSLWPLRLYGSNTYSGVTTISWGDIEIWNDHALGSPAGGTVINQYGTLRLHEVHVLGESLSLSNTDGYSLSYNGTNSWSGPVTLDAWTYIASSVVTPLTGEDQLTLSGPISGPGDLELNGAGTVIFSGAAPNSYGGKTTVYGGKLRLGKPAGTIAVPGNLIISAYDYLTPIVQLNSDNQINPGPVGYVHVKNHGTLDLNNHNQTVPELRLSDNALVDSGPNGLLTLHGNISSTPVNGGNPAINGRMSLGGADRFITVNDPTGGSLLIGASISDGIAPAGFTANGLGTLHLSGSNSFSGTLIADRANLWIEHNLALGAVSGGTVLSNGANLNMREMTITGETLIFAGPHNEGVYCQLTNTWAGPVQLVSEGLFSLFATDAVFTVSGPITGPGALRLLGPGTVKFSGTAPNTFTGLLTANVGLLELAKTNAIAMAGSLDILTNTVRYRAAHQIIDTAQVQVSRSATLDLNSFIDSIGDLSGDGEVKLGNGVLTVGGANPTNTFSGVISGAGGELDKIGPNVLVLSGTNTYTSGTLVKGGTLIVNGAQPSSDVYVYPAATLCGTGRVGNLYGLGGTIDPGDNVGKLSCGNVTFNTNTTFAVELKGTNAGALYDQLNVSGNVIINGGRVTLKVTKHFTGAIGNQYVIVNNDFSDLGLGSFAGLPSGATVTASDGTSFRVDYNAGIPANDIVLTQLGLPVAPQLGGITRLGDGTIQLGGTGLPGATYTVQGNFDLNTTNWLNLGDITAANPSGLIQFIDLDATNHPMRFYRFLLP